MILDELFGDAGAFVAEYWGRQPHVSHSDVPKRVTLPDLESVLTMAEWPYTLMVQDGVPVDPYRFGTVHTAPTRVEVDGDRLAKAFNSGATITANGLRVQVPALSNICSALDVALGTTTDANVYLTPDGARGLGTHPDTHDVIVLQVAGTKRWHVYRPDHADVGEPELVVDLEPGMVLYLPRGWPHHARSCKGATVHVSLGVPAPTWASILPSIAANLDASVPPPSAPDAVWEAAARRALTTAAEQIADRDLPIGALRAAAVGTDDGSNPYPRAVMDVIAVDSVETRFGLAGSAFTVERSDDPSMVTFTIDEQRFSLPATTSDALERIASGECFRAADLEGTLDADSVSVLLRRLAAEGLITRR